MSGRGVRLLSAAAGVLVVLLPRRLRAEYGAEIRQAIADRVVEGAAAAGVSGAVRAAAAEAADVLRTAVALRRGAKQVAVARHTAAGDVVRRTPPLSRRLRPAVLHAAAATAAAVAAIVVAREQFAGSGGEPAHYEELTVNAVDPAGPFSLTLRRGRLVAGTLAGEPLPPERLRQTGHDIHIMHEDGTVLLALKFEPPGLLRWEARVP